MLEPLKESEVFLISSEDLLTRPHVYVSEKRRDAVRELGLLQSRTLLIVVEDVDSKAAVWSLINKWGRGISSSVDVAIVYEGANDVKSFVNKFPKDAVICKAIAILDGDKRTGNANEHFFDYLPGLHDPVQCARSFALKDCSYLSSMIGVDCDALNRVLKRLEYVDHHDFISKLIDELQLSGRTVQDVRIALMNQWLQSPEVFAEGPTLVEKIVGYLDEPRK